MAAGNPLGQRGLPGIYRDMALGKIPAAMVQPQVQQAAAAPTPAPAPAQQAMAANDGLFDTPPPPDHSMNELCNQTGNFTTANGGLATATTITDPSQAMSEQFCLARGFATSQSKQIADSLGANQDKVSSICTQFKTNLAPAIADYGTKTPGTVLGSVSGLISAKALDPAKVQTTARICLGEGYRVDDAVLASVSAIALTAGGEKPYAEVVSHHLREGFGVVASPAASNAWMGMALSSLNAGDAPVFLPGQSKERAAVLAAALAGM